MPKKNIEVISNGLEEEFSITELKALSMEQNLVKCIDYPKHEECKECNGYNLVCPKYKTE